mgnify:CR=1 FL=1
MPHAFLPLLTFAAAWGVLVLTPGTETALVIRLGMNVGHLSLIPILRCRRPTLF